MKIDYEKLKELCKEKGLNVLEATNLGDGILGRFYAPNIILINPQLCDEETYRKQSRVLVLLHEVCHWFKWQDAPEHANEEACFEFEHAICHFILEENVPFNKDFEAIKRLGLEKPMEFLKEVIEKCAVYEENDCTNAEENENMKLSAIDYVQVIVRVNGKYHLVLLNENTQKMLPELIAGMENKLRVLETELPLEEIPMEELKKLSNMNKEN